MTTAAPAHAATAAVDNVAADFLKGATTSTTVASSSDGEVILASTAGSEFEGTALPTGWTNTPLNTGGASTVSGGQVSVDGSLLRTDATYAAGGSLQFDATFSDVGYESVGLGSSLDGTPWAIFSTKSDGSDLMTSVLNPTDSATPLTQYLDDACLGLCIGHLKHYRIDWTTTSVTFWINDALVYTQPVTAMSAAMGLVISDLAAGDTKAVTVSSMRLLPYQASGTFTSRVFDAGAKADWGSLTWVGSTPTGTGLTFKVHTGNTAAPDGTWSTLTTIANGGDVTTYGRYLQYEATETTTVPDVTPVLESVSIPYVVDADAPTITTRAPASGATDVAVATGVTVTFSEPVVAPAGSVTLKHGSTVVASSAATTGSTVSLTPPADLAVNTAYTVAVTAAITDVVGNPLTAEEWSFTTAKGTLTAGTPTITGTVGVGQTLTADEGTWGPAPVTFSYQWYRGSTAVTTDRTYAVTAADVGSKLSVAVTGTKTGYTTASRTSDQTVTVEPGTFVPATPTITGTPAIGELLTAHAGAWDPVPDSLAYQWLRGSTEISGATEGTYTVTAADAGATLKVRVTGSKANYTTVSTTSDPTATVPKGTLSPTPTPTITGTVVVGKVLTAEPGPWGPGTVDLAYQWLRGSSEISGEVGKTYQVTGADAGSTLSVRVTGTKTGYTTVSMTSVPTGAVPSVLAPNPTVAGVVRVGMPLKAIPGTWVPTPTKVAYQWYWLKNSGARVTIKHATKATYTPTASVQGRRLEVRVKAYRSGTLIASRYSSPTGKVAAGMTAKTPKISDTTPVVGESLTADPGTWKPMQTTFTYQWYARSKSGKVTRITGATTSTYTVEARYTGCKLKVKVAGKAPDYATTVKTSSYTHKIG